MSVFGDYADYYDLLYADKDYAREAAFVRDLIRRYSPGAKTLLELGCGTARHAAELVKDGFTITGVDISPRMIELARKRISAGIELTQGDVTNFKVGRQYDAVISLFHVVSYQTTDAALSGIVRSARSALGKGGVFVFDFWYGPAVLVQKPERREKIFNGGEVTVRRIAEPAHHAERNTVDVNFTLQVSIRAGEQQEIHERHAMRYLFLPEIETLAAAGQFEIMETGEWLTRRPLNDKAWSGYAVLRAT